MEEEGEWVFLTISLSRLLTTSRRKAKHTTGSILHTMVQKTHCGSIFFGGELVQYFVQAYKWARAHLGKGGSKGVTHPPKLLLFT